jgi:hypothetical protein
MRLRLRLFTLLLTVLVPGSLWAVVGTIDVTPAATLLFPYFEVDLSNPNGRTTVVTILAATPSATLAHVTFWTDLGIPTYAFDVYLTGYDMQPINLRDVFNGHLPLTADAGEDFGDSVTNQGHYSQDVNFPGTTGPCGAPYSLIPSDVLAELRAAHTGLPVPSTGAFKGRDLGDSIARGFLTVDTVNSCSQLLPNHPDYFATVASNQNYLLGDYLLVDLDNNFMESETAVHIEASDSLLGHRTFYGRLASAAGGIDRREPLPSHWALGALTDSCVSPIDELLVWRDPGVETTPIGNPAILPAPFPMPVSQATGFDDESRVISLTTSLAPVATSSTRLVPDLFDPGTKLGWVFLDLDVGSGSDDVRQSWVTVAHTWEGRFATATNGVVLDPPLPGLQLVGASCLGGTVQLVDDGAPRFITQGCANPLQLNYRLRLFDSGPRSVTGQVSLGTWAGPPAEAAKTTTVAPGEFDTTDVWGVHEAPGGGEIVVEFSVPGGSPAQFLTFRVF